MLTITGCGNPSPGDVAEGFVEKTFTGSGEDLLEFLDTSEATAAELQLSKVVLNDFVEQSQQELNMMGLTFHGVKAIKEKIRDDNTAKVTVEMKLAGPDGEVKEVTHNIKLRLVNDRWCIDHKAIR